MTELLDNNIKYDMCITGPQGARFTLYANKDYHTPEEIDLAKRQLYAEQDVVKIYVEWLKNSQWVKIPVWFHLNRNENKRLNSQFHREICKHVKKF